MLFVTLSDDDDLKEFYFKQFLKFWGVKNEVVRSTSTSKSRYCYPILETLEMRCFSPQFSKFFFS